LKPALSANTSLYIRHPTAEAKAMLLSRRRSLRLRGYDYAKAGAYFVTAVTQDREALFGEFVNGEMALSNLGRIVDVGWDEIAKRYAHAQTASFVVMPNHVHCIVILTQANGTGFPVGAGLKPARAGQATSALLGAGRRSLPEIVRGLKTFTASRINDSRRMPGKPVWQRGYYEHIVREHAELDRIRRYIAENPARWDLDPENR
jgi:putative transposase